MPSEIVLLARQALTGRKWPITCLVILLAGVFPDQVTAAPALVTAEVAANSPPARSDAPVTIIWKLKSQSPSLLEGHLELLVKEEQRVLVRQVTDDIVISTGEQLQRTVLPPLETSSVYSSVEVHLSFVGKPGRIELGNFSLRVPKPAQWSRVVAICDPWQAALAQEKYRFIQSFRFEAYHSDATDRSMTTLTAHIRPDEMPGDALGYCSYDQVLLVAEGLADLKDTQLKSLLQWAEAGGSLCVVPENVALRPAHVRFLNDLVGNSGVGQSFLLDGAGRLVPPVEEAAEKQILKRYGLGRVAVVTGPLRQTFEATPADHRRLLAFLWKMRTDQAAGFVATGKWELPEQTANQQLNQFNNRVVINQRQFGNPYSALRPPFQQLGPMPLQTGDQLLGRLMPQNLKLLPLPLMGVILLVFVAVIGPVDYLFLGWLKRRKWTWILFPAASLGFALLTVELANWSMQIADNRRGVVFRDIGNNNRIARQNRFEVLFFGAERSVTTEVSGALFAALSHRRYSGAVGFGGRGGLSYAEDGEALVAPPEIRGRVPARYAARQYLPQWTPQLNRIFSIPAETSDVEFDWNVFADRTVYNPSTLESGPARTDLIERIRKSFGNSSIHMATSAGMKTLSGPANVFGTDNPYAVDFNFNLNSPGRRFNNVYYPSGYAGDFPVGVSFLGDVCVNQTGGLFSLVSQVAPTGGVDFDDLALLDPSDPNAWLLIVSVERGDDLVIYRKLYAGDN